MRTETHRFRFFSEEEDRHARVLWVVQNMLVLVGTLLVAFYARAWGYP